MRWLPYSLSSWSASFSVLFAAPLWWCSAAPPLLLLRQASFSAVYARSTCNTGSLSRSYFNGSLHQRTNAEYRLLDVIWDIHKRPIINLINFRGISVLVPKRLLYVVIAVLFYELNWMGRAVNKWIIDLARLWDCCMSAALAKAKC